MSDSLRAQAPRLSREQEVALAHRAHAGDLDARNALALSVLPIARTLALRFSGGPHTAEDLVQEQILAAIQAVSAWDPARNIRFATYAYRRLYGRLLHLTTREHSLIYCVRTRKERLRRAMRDIAAQGLTPTSEALAEHLNCDVAEVLAIQAADQECLSLDMPCIDARDSERLIDRLPDPGPGVEQLLLAREEAQAERQLLARLADALGRLTQRERSVVIGRVKWRLSQERLAQDLGISQMHVSRLERRAYAKLRLWASTPVYP